MAENWVSYEEIKRGVTLNMAFGHYGIRLRRVNKSSLRGMCPLPTHGSDESKASFSASLEKNAWACQSRSCISARGGRRGGNVLDFVAVMEACSIREAALKLQDWFLKDGAKPVLPPTPHESVAEYEPDGENKPLTFTLKGIDSSHPWLQRRGISNEVAAAFGVGFFPGKGMMAGRVVIPIHNAKGELVAYAGRAIDEETDPRYLLPTGFNKSREVYNLHRAIEADRSRGVVIVEGFFDAMKVHEAGMATVVALMGSSLSDTQAELIGTNFKRAMLMLDNDEAGTEALPKIAVQLAERIDLRIAGLPTRAQPDSLSTDELRVILNSL